MCGWRREGYTSIKTANDAFTLRAIQPKNEIHNEDVKHNAVSLKNHMRMSINSTELYKKIYLHAFL